MVPITPLTILGYSPSRALADKRGTWNLGKANRSLPKVRGYSHSRRGRLTDMLEEFGRPVLQSPLAPRSKPPVLARAAMRSRESCFRVWAALSRFVDEGAMIRKEYEYRRNELVV